MKAITVLQPYASLIACGAKRIETRSWATKYRGPIAIHAGLSKKYSGKVRESPFYEEFSKHERGPVCMNWDRLPELLPYGKVIAIVDLIDCQKVIGKASLKIGDQKQMIAILENQMRIAGNEFAFGDYEVGRSAWILANVRRIDPVPVRGMQRIWEWENDK